MSVELYNEGIASGWRVQAAERLQFHVPDPSGAGTFRWLDIEEGSAGLLTGQISIYYAGCKEDLASELALDTDRLRHFLTHPEVFKPVRGAANYREAVKKLKGDELLAAFVALDVRWNGIPRAGMPEERCLSFLPWLKLAESGDGSTETS